MTLVALPQGGGVKRTMLPMLGPRVMAASVSFYPVVQVDVHAPFDKGRLVVHEHVTFDWVRGLDALHRWDPPARHPQLALNTT